MVRSGQPIIGRPDWYDRNPVPVTRTYYALDIAPHSDTERWTYTTPSGKKAWVEACNCALMRTSVATTLARSEARIQISLDGIVALRVVWAVLYDNTVGAREIQHGGYGMLLDAGDNIAAHSYDGSTAGTLSIVITGKITEFDA